MLKHLMGRLLNTGVFVAFFLVCNISASAVTLTGCAKTNENIENQPRVTETVTGPSVTLLTPEELVATSNLPKPEYKKGWTKTEVEVKKKPDKNSKTIFTLIFNKKVKYKIHNKNWVKIKSKKQTGYVLKEYIKRKENKNTVYNVPSNHGYKCGEYYTAITCTSSPQYKLQHEYAYTGNYGIRMVNGRYCVAIGSYFNCHIGQYFTLVLENGTKIECIKGDEKADCDTDYRNIFSGNGCMSEFLITRDLVKKARLMGDVSYCTNKWRSPVVKVIVYKKNVLKGGR